MLDYEKVAAEAFVTEQLHEKLKKQKIKWEIKWNWSNLQQYKVLNHWAVQDFL